MTSLASILISLLLLMLRFLLHLLSPASVRAPRQCLGVAMRLVRAQMAFVDAGCAAGAAAVCYLLILFIIILFLLIVFVSCLLFKQLPDVNCAIFFSFSLIVLSSWKVFAGSAHRHVWRRFDHCESVNLNNSFCLSLSFFYLTSISI